MTTGTTYKAGDVVLIQLQFTDSFQVKTRPALILYKELGNIIVAGITSNLERKGISLTKKDGMNKKSIIKTNYVFTLTELLIKKKLTTVSLKKKQEVHEAMQQHLQQLQ